MKRSAISPLDSLPSHLLSGEPAQGRFLEAWLQSWLASEKSLTPKQKAQAVDHLAAMLAKEAHAAPQYEKDSAEGLATLQEKWAAMKQASAPGTPPTKPPSGG